MLRDAIFPPSPDRYFQTMGCPNAYTIRTLSFNNLSWKAYLMNFVCSCYLLFSLCGLFQEVFQGVRNSGFRVKPHKALYLFTVFKDNHGGDTLYS